jgi:excisionase family DNA binding protein
MIATRDSNIEPFVAADTAARFLSITRRRVLQMARAGEIPAHPIGRGKRKQWRFRLSELADAFVTETPACVVRKQGIIDVGQSPASQSEELNDSGA